MPQKRDIIAEACFYIGASLPQPALEAWLESLSDEDRQRLSAWITEFSLAFESIFGPISEAFEEIGQVLTDGIGNGATNA